MAGEPENQRIARLTPLANVIERMKALVTPVEPRVLDLAAAHLRVLAEDVTTDCGSPGESRALVDGYAVRADAITDAGPYAPVAFTTAPVRVDVGDALPPGTDAVVPLDAINNRAGLLQAVAPAVAGEGVLQTCADADRDTVVAQQSSRLTSIQLAALAAIGTKRARVREPRVRLVQARAEPDAVLDAIGDLLARALAMLGCAVARSAGDLSSVLGAAETDAVIGIGGTGAGRNDSSVTTLARHGRIEAHGIAIAPGESAAFGTSGSRPVLLLPGRLDAAIAGWVTIGVPLVEQLAGRTHTTNPRIAASLARKVASPLGLVEVVPVRLKGSQAEPIASGYWPLGPLTGSDGWILVPADSEGFPVGSEVMIRPWP
jgi:molybdopterin molybdotransferase